MFLTKFFKSVGSFFKGLFNASQKTWDNLSPEIKLAMEQGSKLVAVINENIDASPAFVFELMQLKYPEFTKEKLHEILQKGTEGLNVIGGVNNPEILTTIMNLQSYLGSLKGKAWANMSQTIGKGIAAFLAPKETKFAVISSLFEFLYQTYIKKRD